MKSWTDSSNDGGILVNTLIPLDRSTDMTSQSMTHIIGFNEGGTSSTNQNKETTQPGQVEGPSLINFLPPGNVPITPNNFKQQQQPPEQTQIEQTTPKHGIQPMIAPSLQIATANTQEQQQQHSQQQEQPTQQQQQQQQQQLLQLQQEKLHQQEIEKQKQLQQQKQFEKQHLREQKQQQMLHLQQAEKQKLQQNEIEQLFKNDHNSNLFENQTPDSIPVAQFKQLNSQPHEQILDQQQPHGLEEQQVTESMLNNFKQQFAGPNSVVQTGTFDTTSTFNPNSGMKEIPLATMVIPFGDAKATNNDHNFEKMTHVPGDDKNAVPKYHKIPTHVQSNKINNKNKLTDLHRHPISLEPVGHSTVSHTQPFKTFPGQTSAIKENFPQLNKDTATYVQNSNNDPIVPGTDVMISDSIPLDDSKKNIYPTPKMFENSYVWNKEVKLPQTKTNTYTGAYPRPRLRNTTTNLTPKSTWSHRPMKLKVSFEPNHEGKISFALFAIIFSIF